MHSHYPRWTSNLAALLALLCAFPVSTGIPQTDVEERKQSPRPPSQKSEIPPGTKVLRDLEYRENGHARNKLDLYLPEKSQGPLPLAIWVHGGAWWAGSKEKCPAVPLIARGYAVASLNYRLSQHATFPAQIEDCQTAIRWLRAHAEQYGLDPDRFGAWGASAGGHLVALMGTAGDGRSFATHGEHRDVSCRVQAVCDWFGPTDFLQMDAQAGADSRIVHNAADSPESKLIGGPIQQHQDKSARANPITYISDDDPSFLIVHGDRDRLVPVGQSQRLHAALRKQGVEATLHVIKDAGHGFTDPAIRESVWTFFDQHLKRNDEE